MFAVPGWSVSASNLKIQQETKPNDQSRIHNGNGQLAAQAKKSKKRKRSHGKINNSDVTNENVAELWQKHIEGKDSLERNGNEAGPPKKKKKRHRKPKSDDPLGVSPGKDAQDSQQEIQTSQRDPASQHGLVKHTNVPVESSAAPKNGQTHTIKQQRVKTPEKSKSQKAEAQLSKRSMVKAPRQSSPDPSRPVPPKATTPTVAPIPPPLPRTTKLTPLQTAMRAKLISARFRHLNETLYTTPSSHASTLFSSNPEAFASYHAGFRAQVASWPSNPADIFIAEIKIRGTVGGPRTQKQLYRAEKKKKGGKKDTGKDKHQNGTSDLPPENGGGSMKVDPLPRSQSTKLSTIIDLGCGDAQLHASLIPHASSLNLKLQSFDLAAGAGPNASLVTVSDIAHLPLADGSADIAIFCLALMGTNWIDFVAEAARVVRPGGECWVGEVRSRFAGAKDLEKLKGKANEQKKISKRKKRENDESDDDLRKMGAPLLVEEDDGVAGGGKSGKSRDQETDVGPFMEVFRRRGFVLKGEVDMGNKMFVRMRFLRLTSFVNGGTKRQDGPKFVERDDDEGVDMDPEIESKVLKPCVYKTR